MRQKTQKHQLRTDDITGSFPGRSGPFTRQGPEDLKLHRTRSHRGIKRESTRVVGAGFVTCVPFTSLTASIRRVRRPTRPSQRRLGPSCAALVPGGQTAALSGASNCGPSSSTKPPCLRPQWAALPGPVWTAEPPLPSRAAPAPSTC